MVFRSIAGIDSIVQAAGRCNREGKRKNSIVYVFKPDEQSYLGLGYLKLTSQIGEGVINNFDDILSIEAISKYFLELFNHTIHRQDKHSILYLKLTSQIGEGVINNFDDILSIEAISKYFLELFNHTIHRQDKHSILDMIDKRKKTEINYDFEKISNEFKFIDNIGVQIIIPVGEGEKLLNSLKYSEKAIKSILRKLNRFSINIPDYVFRQLIKDDYIYQISDDIFALKNLQMYDSKLGFDKDKLENYDYIV